MRVESAGDAGDRRRYDERRKLVGRQVDAHHAGRRFVGADSFHGAADARPANRDEPCERSRQCAENPDEARLFGNAVEAEGAAGIIPVEKKNPQNFAEPDGGDGEIDARQPQRRRADHECEQRRRSRRDDERDGEGHAELDRQERRRIGTDAHEGRLSERQLADREHDIHRQREQRIHAERID